MPAPLLKILKEGKSRALFLPCCGPVAALLLNNSTLSAKFSSDFFFRVPLLARKKDLKLFSVSMSKVMALGVIKRFGSCWWPATTAWTKRKAG